MSQVSTPGFDFLFSIKERTEERIEKVASRLAKAEQKFAEFSDDPITLNQQYQLGRYQALIDTRSARLTALQQDLVELDAFIPKDEFGFNNFQRQEGEDGRDVLTWNVTVTDSPYDDTYVGGENIRVRVISRKDGVKYTSTVGTGQFAEDGTITFGVGSANWAELTEDAKGKLQIVDADENVLYSVGYNNIV